MYDLPNFFGDKNIVLCADKDISVNHRDLFFPAAEASVKLFLYANIAFIISLFAFF